MAMGSFSMQLDAFKVKSEKQARLVVQKIAMEAFKRVIMRSPVDTGRFRANWGVQIGSPYAGASETFDKGGSATAARAMQAVNGWNGTGSIGLYNNVQYSINLEYGSSQQAPGGMVRLTVAEMGGVAQGVAVR